MQNICIISCWYRMVMLAECFNVRLIMSSPVSVMAMKHDASKQFNRVLRGLVEFKLSHQSTWPRLFKFETMKLETPILARQHGTGATSFSIHGTMQST